MTRALDELTFLEWQDPSGQTMRLYADACTEEQITLSSDVTEHPVEVGADITDHVRAQPTEVSLTLFFSNSPIRQDLVSPPIRIETIDIDLPQVPTGIPLGTGAAIGAIGSALFPGPSKITVQVYEARDGSRVTAAHDIIQTLRVNGTLVAAKTSVTRVENCAITSAVITRSPEHGDGGEITLALKAILFAQSDVTLALPAPQPKKAQKKKDAGKGEKPIAEPKVSSLKATLNAAGITKAGSGIPGQ